MTPIRKMMLAIGALLIVTAHLTASDCLWTVKNRTFDLRPNAGAWVNMMTTWGGNMGTYSVCENGIVTYHGSPTPAYHAQADWDDVTLDYEWGLLSMWDNGQTQPTYDEETGVLKFAYNNPNAAYNAVEGNPCGSNIQFNVTWKCDPKANATEGGCYLISHSENPGQCWFVVNMATWTIC
mmetsp:Transcript_73396/g.116991  ORF Transcript_73396/g.116991 Transcript_73396/m.116991 type:complete len:180 (-) Transcript_73396:43-582(-)